MSKLCRASTTTRTGRPGPKQHEGDHKPLKEEEAMTAQTTGHPVHHQSTATAIAAAQAGTGARHPKKKLGDEKKTHTKGKRH
jgi:hypothetical protein